MTSRVVNPRTVLSAALALVIVLGFLMTAKPAGAAVNGGAEFEFVGLLNAARAQAGLPPLVVRDDLLSLARVHSAVMGNAGQIYHNPSLANDVADWQRVGENVGRGPTVQSVHDAFMASPGHRANILSGDFTEVGIGVDTREGGYVWVTEVFRLPMGGGYVAAPAPAPDVSAEPAPVVEELPAPPVQEQPVSTAPAPTAAPATAPTPAPTAAPAPAPAPAPAVDAGHATLMLATIASVDSGQPLSHTLAQLLPR